MQATVREKDGMAMMAYQLLVGDGHTMDSKERTRLVDVVLRSQAGEKGPEDGELVHYMFWSTNKRVQNGFCS